MGVKKLHFIFHILYTFNIFVEVISIVGEKPVAVQDFAEKIGIELWEIGSHITKRGKIAERYRTMNASVKETQGEEILKTIAVRMNRLIKEKVDAVMRIKNAAMEAEGNFTGLQGQNADNVEYYNSKFSNSSVSNESITISTTFKIPPDNQNYATLNLAPDPHFDDVLVNVTHSSVHVPTNIFDRWTQVIEPIIWSENLDKTFLKNYEQDSSLMWQYFASVSGFLRHFPAFHWKPDPDKFDCRRQIWYIQAATCSKEVVILIDNSGTMYGMRNTIAQLTVDSLLQTFSNNDYINIFRLFEDNVTALVPCFEDTLIQATPENIDLFKKSLYDMCPERKINYKVAFIRAFTMLHDFLVTKTSGTMDPNENRNQAVFLLTDMLIPDKELLEIRNDYERIYNDTNVQVELFLYFIGQDVTDVREIQWEKCLRKGSVVHVRTMDEVPEDALKYISVLARTQNESTEYYPITWTHAFLDIKKDKGQPVDTEENESEKVGTLYKTVTEHRMMTAVTTPVYSSNKQHKGHEEELIGVGAIEVPISDFERLTMPHKIGVNGYAFIVTNNGYLLSHPDLRPFQNGELRRNFNSIDLTEVEFFDDIKVEQVEQTARNPHERILDLRRRMVNHEFGSELDMQIKFHFDDQKRVGSEVRNYYFAPLKCSPFSLGVSVPEGYGNYWVKTTDEINKSKSAEEDYKQYFKGNWQIHPTWSYCDYRDNKKYEIKNPKEKLMMFFDMIFNNETFEWIEEHPNEQINMTSFNSSESFESCFANDTTKKPEKEYYCDKELVELLYFDAKLTQEEFPENMTEEHADFMRRNDISLRFVATQGGLTRWETYPENQENESFGEKSNKALDEVWYKSAVLLHEKNSPKFVFSIPQDIERNNETEKFITAAHAIFYNEDGNEAPGVVVGFRIKYKFLKNKIENITQCSQNDPENRYDCYVIDSNGFIIYSIKNEEIGKFIGTIVGGAAAMQKMVEQKIFRKIQMFDYQAMQKKNKNITTSASSPLPNPFSFITRSVNWALAHLVWFFIQMNVWQYIVAADGCSVEQSNSGNSSCSCRSRNRSCDICCKAPKDYEDRCKTREVLAHIESEKDYDPKTDQQLVDKKFTLFLYTNLSSSHFNQSNGKQCSRPFHAARINKTNLILLIVDALHETCENSLSIEQEVIKYNTGKGGSEEDIPACKKKIMNSYPRRKLRGCSDKIIQNRTREDCGAGHYIAFNWRILIGSAFTIILFNSYLVN